MTTVIPDKDLLKLLQHRLIVAEMAFLINGKTCYMMPSLLPALKEGDILRPQFTAASLLLVTFPEVWAPICLCCVAVVSLLSHKACQVFCPAIFQNSTRIDWNFPFVITLAHIGEHSEAVGTAPNFHPPNHVSGLSDQAGCWPKPGRSVFKVPIQTTTSVCIHVQRWNISSCYTHFQWQVHCPMHEGSGRSGAPVRQAEAMGSATRLLQWVIWLLQHWYHFVVANGVLWCSE